MTNAIDRIVVQATPADKKAITAKAKRLSIPVSELMRRGAFAYQPDEDDAQMGALADAAKVAAERAAASIDETIIFVEASNRRIAEMEAKALATAAKKPARRKVA